MTQAFNLSQFANNVNSAGVAQTGGGGTGTNIASNDLTVNGLTVGKGGGAISTNTAVGASALSANTTGFTNTAIGNLAVNSNTTGDSLVGVGYGALYANTTGEYNIAIGREALRSNTTASNNTAVGYQAGYNSTGNNGIVAVGYQAGYGSTNSSSNAQSIFIGSQSGLKTTTGVDNVYVGTYVASASTNTGSQNTALGNFALNGITTGGYNTAVGYGAGNLNTTGQQNTFIGRNAGSAVTTGTLNMFIGDSSGQAITTGGKNTIIGSYQGNSGGLDIRTASNYIVLSDGDGNPRAWFRGSDGLLFSPPMYATTSGNSANVVVNPDGGVLRSTSALKYKQNIRDLESIDINKFRPVRYKSKCEGDDQTKDHFGFIADEVDEAGIKELVQYGAENEIEGFSYDRLTAVLVKTIQDLQKRIEILENK